MKNAIPSSCSKKKRAVDAGPKRRMRERKKKKNRAWNPFLKRQKKKKSFYLWANFCLVRGGGKKLSRPLARKRSRS